MPPVRWTTCHQGRPHGDLDVELECLFIRNLRRYYYFLLWYLYYEAFDTSVFARKKRERQEGETKLREKYTEAGLKLSDIDRMETPDMYNAGGMNGIIPGVQLSTLMEDD